MSWLEEYRETLSQIPLSAFPSSMRDIVCIGLDKLKIRETDDNISRDYCGLIKLMPLDAAMCKAHIENTEQPTDLLLNLWQKFDSGITVMTLLDAIMKMTRYDIIDDLEPLWLSNLSQLRSKYCFTNESVEIISQEIWGDKPCGNSKSVPLPLPVNSVILTNYDDDVTSDLYEIARQRRQKSINLNGATDINCNFLISPDGKILEGTGWKIQCGHSIRQVKWSIIITLVGNYDEQIPDARMMDAICKLIEYGVSKGYIDRFYSIYAMSRVTETKNVNRPGQKVMDIVEKWEKYEAEGNSLTNETYYDY